MKLAWGKEKNTLLKKERGLSFEMVRDAVDDGRLLADVPNLNRKGQRILVILLNDYVHAAPYVQDGDTKFLKTLFPSRDFNAIYGAKDG